MTAQHTPEPWRTIKDHNGNDYGVQMGSAGGFALYRDANAEANSRRIVACVNACAGIDTEVLEVTHGLDDIYNDIIRELDALKQQRDELLAALDSAVLAEREACAKMCDERAAIERKKAGYHKPGSPEHHLWAMYSANADQNALMAKEIRARGAAIAKHRGQQS